MNNLVCENSLITETKYYDLLVYKCNNCNKKCKQLLYAKTPVNYDFNVIKRTHFKYEELSYITKHIIKYIDFEPILIDISINKLKDISNYFKDKENSNFNKNKRYNCFEYYNIYQKYIKCVNNNKSFNFNKILLIENNLLNAKYKLLLTPISIYKFLKIIGVKLYKV